MEEKIRALVNEINSNAGDGYKRFDEYSHPDAHIVASKQGLRLYAAKLLAASLLPDGEDYVFNMQAEFNDWDYLDEVTIKVSDTWEPPADPIANTWEEGVQQMSAVLLLLFVMGAGMYKIYEWVR